MHVSCCDNLNLSAALENAEGKAAGIFPPLVAKALEQALQLGVPNIAWIKKPARNDFTNGIQRLIEAIMPDTAS